MGLRALIQKCGLNARDVVRKETGELIKTLVRISPPKSPGPTRLKIDETIQSKFAAMAEVETDFERNKSKESSTGVKWTGATSAHLFGIMKNSDMRKSSQADLLQVYYRIRGVSKNNFQIVVPFRGRVTHQKVAIKTKITTTKAQVNSLVKRIQGHVGRLKAGWLAAVVRGVVQITGTPVPPQWVLRHANSGVRGRFINGLSDGQFPRFTIINSAKGINGSNSQYFIRSAVAIRAKAMKANALLFMKGKKKLSDYTKGKIIALKS